ncbi:nuclear transport factor 2 family protein [Streptomyces sp. NPDC002623]
MTSIESALQDVLTRNATGTDRLDRELMLSAFHPEGRLIVPSMDFVAEGHDQVGDLLKLQSQFDKTFHFIGNTRFDIADSGDTATGEIYVLAHHLKDGQVRVSAIRYQDSYSRQDGEWRIDERTIHIEWNHTHDTIDSVL